MNYVISIVLDDTAPEAYLWRSHGADVPEQSVVRTALKTVKAQAGFANYPGYMTRSYTTSTHIGKAIPSRNVTPHMRWFVDSNLAARKGNIRL